jgi:uncharacterized membrane protein YhaH (DUF805 family)
MKTMVDHTGSSSLKYGRCFCNNQELWYNMCFFLIWLYQTTSCLAVFIDISVMLNCYRGSKPNNIFGKRKHDIERKKNRRYY